ncbi:MAG TPA: hypothetical protein VK446_07605 [Methylocystis sp.]|nr:hypothetical protein [Methylocystis sp.]
MVTLYETTCLTLKRKVSVFDSAEDALKMLETEQGICGADQAYGNPGSWDICTNTMQLYIIEPNNN